MTQEKQVFYLLHVYIKLYSDSYFSRSWVINGIRERILSIKNFKGMLSTRVLI